MAGVIEAAAAAGARDRPQQDAGRAALQRVPRVLSRQRRRVLRQLLRLLPARGLRPGAGPLHREGLLDQRRDRPAPPLGHRGAARPARRRHRRLGLVHLRDRLAGALPRADAAVQGGGVDRPRRAVPEADRDAVRAQRHQPHPRDLPGQGRAAGGLSGLRRDRLPDRAVRRRGRGDPALRPADRRGARRDRPRRGLAGDPLRDQGGDDRAGGRRHQAGDERAARLVRGAGQAARGPPAAAAHRVRHRAAQGARLRPGDRELLADHRRASRRAARRTP